MVAELGLVGGRIAASHRRWGSWQQCSVAELVFVGGGGAGIHRRWLSWDLVVRELAPGFVRVREGENCWQTQRWDLSVVAKLGFVGGHGAQIPRRAR